MLTLTQDSAEDAKLWAAHNHVDLPIALDQNRSAFKAFEVDGVPITIFANKDGKVEHYWTGFDSTAEMDKSLDSALSTHIAFVSGLPITH